MDALTAFSLLSSVAIAAIMITLPYSPLAGPPGRTAVPAWILPAIAAFYIIASEGPNQDFAYLDYQPGIKGGGPDLCLGETQGRAAVAREAHG